MTDLRSLLHESAEHVAKYRATLATSPVQPQMGPGWLRDALGGPLPDSPSPPEQVVRQLVEAAGPGLVASAGPRYFGFVVGGSLRPPVVGRRELVNCSRCRDLVGDRPPVAGEVHSRAVVQLGDELA